MLQFGELRLILIGIEEKDAAFVRQAQIGRDLRGTGLFGFPFGLEFLVEFDRFRSDLALQAALLKLSGCVPVNQRVRDFLPLAALGAEIADAVAVNLILGDGLVGAVFQNEAVSLDGSGNLGETKEG